MYNNIIYHSNTNNTSNTNANNTKQSRQVFSIAKLKLFERTKNKDICVQNLNRYIFKLYI